VAPKDQENRRTLEGSEKGLPPQSKVVGNVDPKRVIEVTVFVRPKGTTATAVASAKAAPPAASAEGAGPRRPLARGAEFAAERGADPEDFAKIDAFAHAHRLTVTQSSIAQRSVTLSGTVADFTAAFQPTLKRVRSGRTVLIGRTGSLSVPEELAEIVVSVLGFTDLPVAEPHHRRLRRAAPAAAARRGARGAKRATPAAAAGSVGFTPPQVATLYAFPAGLDGSGQTIALIELNGVDAQGNPTGTGYSADDLDVYFQSLGIPTPQVAAIGVNGGANQPGTDSNADGEVMLDIEVAGAVAPGAGIAVYFAPNSDDGFIAAFNAALHDDVRKPSVISISWGGPEDGSSQGYLTTFNLALEDAAHLGVTVCVASGDNGSSDQDRQHRDSQLHCDFPASSPFALACGGTKLVGAGTSIESEVTWNEGDGGGAGGGGVSNVFQLPTYQSAANVPPSPGGQANRGVPDVAGNADPVTGYQVRASGQDGVIGGTSAVAPLWAGLIACINQRLAGLGKPPAGFVNPALYAAPGCLHDIVDGNNDIDGTLGSYAAGPGWDACSGLGSPDGGKVMQTLGG
jgi:kumamolisin